jgi:hypothetical protein
MLRYLHLTNRCNCFNPNTPVLHHSNAPWDACGSGARILRLSKQEIGWIAADFRADRQEFEDPCKNARKTGVNSGGALPDQQSPDGLLAGHRRYS